MIHLEQRWALPRNWYESKWASCFGSILATSSLVLKKAFLEKYYILLPPTTKFGSRRSKKQKPAMRKESQKLGLISWWISDWKLLGPYVFVFVYFTASRFRMVELQYSHCIWSQTYKSHDESWIQGYPPKTIDNGASMIPRFFFWKCHVAGSGNRTWQLLMITKRPLEINVSTCKTQPHLRDLQQQLKLAKKQEASRNLRWSQD